MVICKEYLKSDDIDSQAITIYPIDVDEQSDLNNGTVLQLLDDDRDINGGQISWNTENNSFTYTQGSSGTIDKFYLDETGKVTEIHCTYDPETKCGTGFTGRKVKGTIHWVEASTAKPATIRLYENIVDEEKGVYDEEGNINLNPNSLQILENCWVEPELANAQAFDSFQFVRQGYFCVDAKDSKDGKLVFNRIVSLKSSYKPVSYTHLTLPTT